MSDSKINSVKFDAPEFARVFNRIKEYENKSGYHSLRSLNKFHAEKFEKSINTANLNIVNLQSLTNSKFADQIRFLNVQVPNNVEDLSDLHYVSPTFLHNIEKVNIVFTDGQYVHKNMRISQNLIFRGVNFVYDVSKNENSNSACLKILSENSDIQLTDCNSEGISLTLSHANNTTITCNRRKKYFQKC